MPAARPDLRKNKRLERFAIHRKVETLQWKYFGMSAPRALGCVGRSGEVRAYDATAV